MNYLSDQLSDTSTISQSNSRTIGRMDSLQSSVDCLSIKKSSNKFTSQRTNSIMKTINCLTLCEENIGAYVKANIVYQCIKDATLNHKGTLSESTVNKLKALLLTDELDKYIHLPSQHAQDKLMLLGIINLPSSDFNSDEKLEIKCCVETLLREKIYNIILRYEPLGGDIKKALKSNESSLHSKFIENTWIMQWKSRMENLIAEYESALLKYADLMDKWNKLKYEDMSQIYLEKSQYLLLQAQVVELQTKITRLSCTIKMFQETPTTISAFRMLNEMVEEKLKAIRNEIRQKEDLKKLYDNLRNTEYDEVLKTYTQLCKVIKKKKQILHKLY